MSSSSICSAIGSIPVIDLSSLKQHHHVRDGSLVVVDEVRNACLKLGCFKVINHGISKSVINGALEAASDFFALSTEEKKALASEDIYRPVRYGTCLKEERIKPRDFLKQYAHPLSKWINFWPLSPPHYREKMGKYAVEVRRVALQLMDVILESLGIDHAYLRDKLDDGMQVMTVNNYVFRERTGSILGMAPHSDYGYITILLQSCEGLEIMDRNDSGWRRVKEFPDVLHVHVGDYMEVLSNGRYKSVVHRVVLSCEKRISIASIHGLAMDEMVTVAKELVDEQHPRGYRESNFKNFLSYITRNDFTSGCNYIDSLRMVNN